jgi:hypothetical protein
MKFTERWWNPVSLQVRGRKIILGNPLDMPVVNAYDHHIGRAFLGETNQK